MTDTVLGVETHRQAKQSDPVKALCQPTPEPSRGQQAVKAGI